jgi:hypothetical protein
MTSPPETMLCIRSMSCLGLRSRLDANPERRADLLVQCDPDVLRDLDCCKNRVRHLVVKRPGQPPVSSKRIAAALGVV